MEKVRGSATHRAFAVAGIVLCVILIPVVAVNFTLLIRSFTGSGEVPSVGGNAPMIVMSDSMNPAIEAGDLIVVSSAEASDVEEGDVISFFDPASEGSAVVTHRVVEVTTQDGETAWRTRGDANNIDDAALVPGSKLIGKYAGVRFAGLGNVVLLMQTPVGLAVCVAVPLIILIGYDFIRRCMLDKRRATKAT